MKISSMGKIRQRRHKSTIDNKHYCNICGKKFRLNTALLLHKLEKHNIKEKLNKLSSMLTSARYEEFVYSSDSDCEYSIITTIQRLPKTRTPPATNIDNNYFTIELDCQTDHLTIEPLNRHSDDNDKMAHDRNDEHDDNAHRYIIEENDNPILKNQEVYLIDNVTEPISNDKHGDCLNVGHQPFQELCTNDNQDIHSERFQCLHCQRLYNSRSALSSHMNIVHKGQTNHLCILCGKSFRKEITLDIHMRRHVADKRFACVVCEKRFITRQLMKEHMVVHTREKPFLCRYPGCDKAFGFSNGRRNHYRYVHQPKRFCCKHCQKRFVAPRHLELVNFIANIF